MTYNACMHACMRARFFHPIPLPSLVVISPVVALSLVASWSSHSACLAVTKWVGLEGECSTTMHKKREIHTLSIMSRWTMFSGSSSVTLPTQACMRRFCGKTASHAATAALNEGKQPEQISLAMRMQSCSSTTLYECCSVSASMWNEQRSETQGGSGRERAPREAETFSAPHILPVSAHTPAMVTQSLLTVSRPLARSSACLLQAGERSQSVADRPRCRPYCLNVSSAVLEPRSGRRRLFSPASWF
jgi:hypothetical protein